MARDARYRPGAVRMGELEGSSRRARTCFEFRSIALMRAIARHAGVLLLVHLLAVAGLSGRSWGGPTSAPATRSFETGGAPTSLVMGDLNGDGALDLAVANFGSSTISVLLGRGSRTFGAKADYATGAQPNSIAMGDLNGDGKPDLAVTNTGSSTVSVLLGIGDGSFTAKADHATANGPTAVSMGDVNGDGKVDLVLASGGSNAISVFLGTGDGSLATEVGY